MKNMQNEVILELTKKLGKLFGPVSVNNIKIDLKHDKSFVTEIDLFVSEIIKRKLQEHSQYSKYEFFCEEDFKEYVFPCAILDPIDGTRELIKGWPECAVSLALMQTSEIHDPENFAWLYNPFSGFSLDTTVPFINSMASVDKSSQKLFSFVSRSEFQKGRYTKYLNHPRIDIAQRGSIAFKLGLLASGASDFIVSLNSKNVWDIAAGTILCAQRGIHFYENGKHITKLDRQKYEGTLIWTTPAMAPAILEIFENEFKNEKK